LPLAPVFAILAWVLVVVALWLRHTRGSVVP
jgi:hypothetical protein